MKPWLNTDLYVAIQQKDEKKAAKVERIAQVDSADKVEVVNLYDTMMKNAGIDINKLKEK